MPKSFLHLEEPEIILSPKEQEIIKSPKVEKIEKIDKRKVEVVEDEEIAALKQVMD